MAHNLVRWTEGVTTHQGWIAGVTTHQGRIVTALVKKGITHLIVVCEDGKVREVSLNDVNR